eukprot:EG_transcript_16398
MATSPTPSSPARSSSTTRSQMRCPARLPLVCVVAVAPGLLICLVGFLAWSVPMLRLSRHVHPLAGSVRCQAQNVVVRHVRHTWDAAYADLWERQRRWAAGRQPTDAVAEADYIIRSVAPTFLCNSLYLGGSILTLHGNCTHLFALVHHTLGWFADRQNCTHRWFEWWDPDTQALTGIVFYSQPASPYAMLGLEGAIRATTPQQPFTWNVIWNPHMNVGDLMEANIALYDSESNFVGRTGIAISLGYLRALLQDALQRNATANGRLALYEPDGLVIAASHGRYDTNQRFPMAAIGDPDLEGAAAHLQQAPTDLCPTFSGEVTLSVDYFIDVAAINDTHVSVRHPQWCVLLLTPQANVLGPVQQSHRFA